MDFVTALPDGLLWLAAGAVAAAGFAALARAIDAALDLDLR